MIRRFLSLTRFCLNNGFGIRKPIICNDGFTMSVQASKYHHCEPMEDLKDGFYKSVEIGFLSAVEPLILEYAEDDTCPTDTLYNYVPFFIVDNVINKHGGIDITKMVKSK